MHIIKPNWVIHEDDKGNPQTIYSVHVHPDGTRLATGSIQNVVKIWSTAPILDPALESSGEEKAPRLLCRMEGHDGAVLCVRWTYSGGFLATGSDDSIIMVWTRCPGQSKSFGSKAANIEDWKPFKRLAGHTSDVCGLAWSEDDQYLASVGLDNLVMIWDCLNSAFVPYKRLELHQGHVNGVAWDPVGQYLATQSDDRTVKIWRTSDWKLEADIKAPFVKSPRSFFRRLSWSPDGAHIITPNAMNGPVFVSAVIDRRAWTSDISLVGHENVVEVAAYNPLIFLKDKNAPLEVMNITAVFALGARNSISIWLTSNSTPLVVLHDVFDRDILDLSWAADGITLYACSSEGRVAAFVIDELLEIATIGPADAKAKFHERYQFKKSDRRQQPRSNLSPGPFPARFASPAIEPYRPGSSSHLTTGTVATGANRSDAVTSQQEMTIMPNGKRRIKPVFLGTNESIMFLNSTSSTSEPVLPNHSTGPSQSSHPKLHQSPNHFIHSGANFSGISNYIPPANQPIAHKFHLPLEKSYSHPSSHGLGDIIHWNHDGKWDEPIASCDQISQTVLQDDEGTEFHINCLNVRGDMDESIQYAQVKLSLKTIRDKEEQEELWAEKFTGSKSITSATLNQYYVAIGFSDRSLSVYSLKSGRRIMPMIFLDAACFKLQLRDRFLMAVSIKGTIMVWNLSTFKAAGAPKRLSELNETRRSISFSGLTSEGRVIIQITEGSLFTFDEDLNCWIILSDPDHHPPLNDIKNLSRLNYPDLKFPMGSPFALDASVLLSSSKPQFSDCFLDYVRSLAGSHRFHFLDELCHDLWSGSGWIQSSLNQQTQVSRLDRMKLLHQIIQILDEHKEFQSISQEYSILLKHS